MFYESEAASRASQGNKHVLRGVSCIPERLRKGSMRTTPFRILLVLLATGSMASQCNQKTPDEIPATVTLSAVSPDTVEEGQNLVVTLTGSGFQEGIGVKFGRADGTEVEWVSETTVRARLPDLYPGIYDIFVRNVDDGKASLTLALTVNAVEDVPDPTPAPVTDTDCAVETVYFAFDESVLSDQARKALEANSDCIQKKGLRRIRLEGHADERGSTEYNLALGQRRAESARKYLVGLGVSPSVLSTLSYGEEMPDKPGSSENAWAKNRRVEFNSK